MTFAGGVKERSVVSDTWIGLGDLRAAVESAGRMSEYCSVASLWVGPRL